MSDKKTKHETANIIIPESIKGYGILNVCWCFPQGTSDIWFAKRSLYLIRWHLDIQSTDGWYASGGTSLYKVVHVFHQNLVSLHFLRNSFMHYIQWDLFLWHQFVIHRRVFACIRRVFLQGGRNLTWSSTMHETFFHILLTNLQKCMFHLIQIFSEKLRFTSAWKSLFSKHFRRLVNKIWKKFHMHCASM